MNFDVSKMNSENTPVRWKIVGKDLVDNKPEELDKLEPVYKAALEKAATFTSDNEMGIGNQPNVGSEPEPEPVQPVLVDTVSITGDTADIELPGTTDLGADVLPADADDTSVVWTSDDEAIATVDSDGIVTAIAEGTVNITVTASDASGASDSVVINVVA